MDLSLIYNDPGHQQRASMMGMDMQTYVANMDPRAVQANIANLSRGPAVYNTQEQVDNMSSVGANSGPNAFVGNSPTAESMLNSPMQPQDPTMAPGALNIPSASSPVQTGGTPAALSQPGQGGTLPGDAPDAVRNVQNSGPQTANPHPDAVLTSGGTAATPGALTSGGTTAAAPRPNAGPTSGARQTPTNNTGNSRQSGMPDMRIGRMAQLGRMGTAMLGSAGNGLLASMSAGGEAMYAVNDENRAAEMGEYENSERLRLEEAQRRAAAARSGSGGAGGVAGGAGGVAGGGIYQRATLTALDAIQGYINRDNGSSNPFNNINGFTGNWLAARPGTPAHDVAGLLNTVEGAIGFDRLDAMRKASKTGGALGAISERELALLSSSLASLRQSASAKEFQRNITLVRTHYQSAVAAIDAQLAADAGQTPAAPGGQTKAPAFKASDYTVVEITEQ